MTNIVRFLNTLLNLSARRRQEMPKPSEAMRDFTGQGFRFLTGLFGTIRIVVVPLSPLIRMLYYWKAPGMHAGWTFLLHFCALLGLTWYVAFGKAERFLVVFASMT